MRRSLIFTGLLLGVGCALIAQPAAAHAIGGVFTLPVPLWLYLAGAGLAVTASFAAAVVVVQPAGERAAYPVLRLPDGLSRPISVVLRVLGLAWWLGAMAAGIVVDPISPLPAVLVWIGIWVALPIVAALLGNPWPSLSPFRTLFDGLERLARLVGFDRVDAGLRYPAWLGRWPAVAWLGIALWCELILPDASAPSSVATLAIGYTLLTLGGMALFGRIAWLRNAELFEVLLGWFGRIGPIGRRVTEVQVCQGCTEACDPTRCVDCPECAVAADPGERRAELRPWFAGLTEVRGGGWSDAAFIVLALAGVTFDGLSETVVWGAVLNPAFGVLVPVFGAADTVMVVQTAGLIGLWLAFLAAFGMASNITRGMHDPDRPSAPVLAAFAGYAATLLPIAAGYMVAHYLTLVVQGAIWLPALLVDPLQTVAPLLDFIPIGAIWYLSVGAIVLGHVVAIVLAHRLALRDTPRHPARAGLPLVLLMVGYTVLSLWIIAQPITSEPGSNPSVSAPSRLAG